MKKLALIVFLIVVLGVVAGCQQTAPKPVAKTKQGELTLDEIGKVVPGLGVLMMEMGERFSIAGYAGKAKAWDLLKYELKETKEAAEVGMITRPKRKDALESFIKGAFAKLEKAAEEEDVAKFNTAFDNTVKACNGCHDSQDFGYIKYELPKTKPEEIGLMIEPIK